MDGIAIDGFCLAVSDRVRLLGVTVSSDLSLTRVSTVMGVRCSLDIEFANKCTFVTSRIDY